MSYSKNTQLYIDLNRKCRTTEAKEEVVSFRNTLQFKYLLLKYKKKKMYALDHDYKLTFEK